MTRERNNLQIVEHDGKLRKTMTISKRQALENRIIQTSVAIRALGLADQNELDNQAIEEHFDAWHELVKYYQEFADTVLDVEVVREYADSVHVLHSLCVKSISHSIPHNRIEEILEELEGYMNEIIKEAVTNKHSTH